MKQPGFGKAALALSVFTCATMFSFDWSEHKGASLSIDRAQAQMGDPSTPAPGAARRRTAAGAAVVGADAVAAGATAAYYGGSGPYAYYGGPGTWSQDYAARNGIICQPGRMVRLDDGLMHRCQ